RGAAMARSGRPPSRRVIALSREPCSCSCCPELLCANLMIEARHLTKIFRDRKRGEIRAADDVSFTVAPGQIYGLLGANGAGKTTTLRMLATLLRPSGGEARVAGFDVVGQSREVRAHVGFLAASTALYGR